MHFGSGEDVCFVVAMAVPVLEFAMLFMIDFSNIVCCFFQEILVCKRKNFFNRRIFFLLRAQPLQLTDIFIMTNFSQKLFDIGFSYIHCKVTPAHQPIKVVLKTAVRSTEYILSTEFTL